MTIRHLLCGLLRGHDIHLKSTPTEVYTACSHCGKRSAGWQVDPARMAHLAGQRVPKRPPVVLHRVLLMKKSRKSRKPRS